MKPPGCAVRFHLVIVLGSRENPETSRMYILKSPSSIDWCEENYASSPFIAEYWNTVSGLALVLSAWVSFRRARSVACEAHMRRACGITAAIGLGTMAFHGSLLYVFQQCDEIPMLLLGYEYLRLVGSLRITNMVTKMRTSVPYARALLAWTVVSYWIHPWMQLWSFFAQLVYVHLVMFYIFHCLSSSGNLIVYAHIRRLSFGTFVQVAGMQRRIKRCSRIGLGLFGFSIAVWAAENAWCSVVQPLQLHAVWHVTTSIGLYVLNEMILTYVLMDAALRNVREHSA